MLLFSKITMIWCFGFFFLDILDDFDEESNNEMMR